MYPEGASGDNRELPALLKRARYARPPSERGRKALAHSLEHTMPVPHQRYIFFDGGIENHLSNGSIGGMKNHLLHDGCLFMTHFQPVCFHGDIENHDPKNDSMVV